MKKQPRTKKTSELDKYMLQCQINAHNAILELTKELDNEMKHLDRELFFQEEVRKLERRYRNDKITFWIFIVISSSIIGLCVGLLLKMFL